MFFMFAVSPLFKRGVGGDFTTKFNSLFIKGVFKFLRSSLEIEYWILVIHLFFSFYQPQFAQLFLQRLIGNGFDQIAVALAFK